MWGRPFRALPSQQNVLLSDHSIDSFLCHETGPGGGKFIGSSKLMALPADNIGGVDYIYWYFNYVFAGTTATIVSGAVAERCQFRAYLVYSFALGGFIYPVCSHWIWDTSGFLNGKVYDFAGGGAVHMVGGVAAASAAYFLGPRTGKFVLNDQGKKVPVDIPGHNMTLASLGAIILWFGFFAFNVRTLLIRFYSEEKRYHFASLTH